MTTTDTDHFVELWYADEHAVTVEQVRAYTRPNNGYWIPEKGVSTTKGHGLHDTRGEAVAWVRGKLALALNEMQKKVALVEKL